MLELELFSRRTPVYPTSVVMALLSLRRSASSCRSRMVVSGAKSKTRCSAAVHSACVSSPSTRAHCRSSRAASEVGTGSDSRLAAWPMKSNCLAAALVPRRLVPPAGDRLLGSREHIDQLLEERLLLGHGDPRQQLRRRGDQQPDLGLHAAHLRVQLLHPPRVL
eukprot:CAMPEP_0182824564 /NCGR_PEP_ID=MMETSP0006_2-20121128/15358_1 /TAXON_ID=97485 /ORGANISM="Prymnesium parvum, Strain Texoma1" /LENGTH=163 /DNA_ID=CAMNT_0024951571 /DNA_START=213 /DNA_END=701 /DNA_ORIENTATION=+